MSGTAVTIVESAWVDDNTEGAATPVDAAADAGLTLPVPPFAEAPSGGSLRACER